MLAMDGAIRRGGVVFAVATSLACLLSVSAFAQGAPATYAGLRGAEPIDPADIEGAPVATLTRAYLPESIDLSDRMPPPIHQIHGSCVSYSVAYAARGYYSAIAGGTKPGAGSSTPSPAYLHTQIYRRDKPCAKSGSDAITALKYLMKSGLPSNETDAKTLICSAEIENRSLPTNGFSVRSFVTNYFVDRTSKARLGSLEAIKQSLASGNPVIVHFSLFKATSDPTSEEDTLASLRPNEIYRGSLARTYGSAGGHAMVLVGYDERRQAFRVQNSWGEEWADGGFGWIGYDAARADMSGAFTMVTSVKPPKPQPAPSKLRESPFTQRGNCGSVAESRAGGGRTRLSGFVESVADLKLLTALNASGETELSVRPWPICEALLTLREPLAAPSRPTVEFLKGDGAFRIGEAMGFRVTTPNFPSFLYLVYLQSDGTVVNLVPRGGPMRRQMPAGTTLVFGDGKDGRQTFRAAEPIGSEAIVAIAARSPLAQLEELEKAGGQFRLSAASRRDDADEWLDDEPKVASPKADARLYLSILRAAMAENPQTQALARETTADVAYVSIAKK